jgi:hypothetical protein
MYRLTPNRHGQDLHMGIQPVQNAHNGCALILPCTSRVYGWGSQWRTRGTGHTAITSQPKQTRGQHTGTPPPE